jgi:hypothetical protein
VLNRASARKPAGRLWTVLPHGLGDGQRGLLQQSERALDHDIQVHRLAPRVGPAPLRGGRRQREGHQAPRQGIGIGDHLTRTEEGTRPRHHVAQGAAAPRVRELVPERHPRLQEGLGQERIRVHFHVGPKPEHGLAVGGNRDQHALHEVVHRPPSPLDRELAAHRADAVGHRPGILRHRGVLLDDRPAVIGGCQPHAARRGAAGDQDARPRQELPAAHDRMARDREERIVSACHPSNAGLAVPASAVAASAGSCRATISARNARTRHGCVPRATADAGPRLRPGRACVSSPAS